MPDTIQLHDKRFKLFISERDIVRKVGDLGRQIENDYANGNPIFIAVLNGAFMFAADLFKHFDMECSITFVKIRSYEGTSSSGTTKHLIGIEESLSGRHVVVIEDIVDTGRTLAALLPELEAHRPASIKVVALVSKTEARVMEVPVHYLGFDIPDRFIVGYGLDYDGLGRNLRSIYQIED